MQRLSRLWQAAHMGRAPSQPILFCLHSLQATETRFLLELGPDGGGERGRVAGRRGRKLLFFIVDCRITAPTGPPLRGQAVSL